LVPSKSARREHQICAIPLKRGYTREPGVNDMNPNGIVAVAILFLVVLFFCMWVSFSARVISPEEILERAGIVAAVAAAILAAVATSRHRHVH
jgi:Ca2+/Na+ antiporter